MQAKVGEGSPLYYSYRRGRRTLGVKSARVLPGALFTKNILEYT